MCTLLYTGTMCLQKMPAHVGRAFGLRASRVPGCRRGGPGGAGRRRLARQRPLSHLEVRSRVKKVVSESIRKNVRVKIGRKRYYGTAKCVRGKGPACTAGERGELK